MSKIELLAKIEHTNTIAIYFILITPKIKKDYR